MSTGDGAVVGTTKIVDHAPANRAFNVVIVAEGYQSGQLSQFHIDAQAFATTLLATVPYDRLGSHINVYRVDVSSTDSGADDPAAAGGTGATARTYFDATFGGNGIRRLLLCNDATALSVAGAQVPQYSMVMVLVNSGIYGGSGGAVATFSLAASANEIGLHEMGHTAFGFADEYDYYAGGNETGHDHHPAGEPGQPNVTLNTDRNTLKWRNFVAATTPLPTSANPNCSQPNNTADPRPGAVGLYEGADYYHCGAYRPQHDCRMRALGFPYCAVCQDVIVRRFAPYRVQRTQPNARINVLARYPEHLDLFTVADDGRVVSTWWDGGSGWGEWFQISGGVAAARSAVTAVARNADHLDLFVVGADNRPYSTWWDAATGWAGWFRVGTATMRSGSVINVVSRTPTHLDLFGVRADGAIISAWWDASSGWSDWFQVSGGVAGPNAEVTAIARYPYHLDLFTAGTDGHVWSTWWDQHGGWAQWFQLPGITVASASPVNVVARHPDHLDLFTVAGDGRVMSTWWDFRTGWAGWFQVSGGAAKPGAMVTAVSRHCEHLDLFTVAPDGRMISTWWDGATGWGNWFQLSGGISAPAAHLTAIARHPDHLDVFGVGLDQNAWSNWWDGATGWANWFQVQ